MGRLVVEEICQEALKLVSSKKHKILLLLDKLLIRDNLWDTRTRSCNFYRAQQRAKKYILNSIHWLLFYIKYVLIM